ncbi:hypothetical protein MJO28_006650 [Puccinia striiformis f. sp. tritici]|uniref:Uncharacterized protein n=2 Tax=Puccinia striiformis f. sp. tritici TaxID=168172 RepID=A0A0L0VVH5_9BASI|nr:hypothetical protein Pst134EB_012789 [Puccinia striiformis f. sp. tritici]KAI7954103.1 hypothetical protein MJO28_006650 [Puccinia striiformis f. sp. tritici]KAI9629360.1 hypothetical protein KEM48_013026 [Puccinia striiformis f. sp. tritici PST-130]KNF03202.1 hypothetical protein PSTG_03789 [Puccinia striiformis f. sp. tritici PST-78]
MLNLTDGDEIKKLVKLAHFNRFPVKKDYSGMSEEEVLDALVRIHLWEETFTGLEIILKGTLELNAGDIKKLIQLAHFKRFRTKEGLSRMSEETMLRALKTVPQAQTNTGIVQRIEYF